MKIYCSRYTTDEEILDRYVGTDYWLKVEIKDGILCQPIWWIRVRDIVINSYNRTKYYRCNYLWVPDNEIYHTTKESYNHLLSRTKDILSKHIKVIKPTEFMCTDEILADDDEARY